MPVHVANSYPLPPPPRRKRRGARCRGRGRTAGKKRKGLPRSPYRSRRGTPRRAGGASLRIGRIPGSRRRSPPGASACYLSSPRPPFEVARRGIGASPLVVGGVMAAWSTSVKSCSFPRSVSYVWSWRPPLVHKTRTGALAPSRGLPPRLHERLRARVQPQCPFLKSRPLLAPVDLGAL